MALLELLGYRRTCNIAACQAGLTLLRAQLQGLSVSRVVSVMATTGCQGLGCMQMKETDTKRKAGKRKTRDDEDNEPEEAVRRGATRGGKRGGRR